MNKLHYRYLAWRFRLLGYDINPVCSRVLYVQTNKNPINFTTSDYKNLFRRYFIKYIWMYNNIYDKVVVRLE